MTTSQLEHYKAEAAEAAVSFVQPGMRIGLGSGSTALYATRRIGALLREGTLHDVLGFPTSDQTRAEAARLGIPLVPDDLPDDLDLTIDGADEIDLNLNVIKGGGGALLREKIVAQASRRIMIIADDTKASPHLGTHHALPVEVLAFGWQSQWRYLTSLSAAVTLRTDHGGAPFRTDSGNFILDANFGPINDPAALVEQLNARAGIVEHGLFFSLVTDVIIAGDMGVRHITRPT